MAEIKKVIENIDDNGNTILSNIIDHNTNQYITYSSVNSYYDGSIMDDDKCDGVIYRKYKNIYVKLNYKDSLNIKIFGAKGDGKTDDTEAFRKAVKLSNLLGFSLYIDNSTYYIKDSINYYDDKYNNLIINISGNIPSKKGEYSITNYGGIKLGKDTSLFKNASIKGSMTNISVVGSRSNNINFFDTCYCGGLVIEWCNISNIESMFLDTNLGQVTIITNNTFLSVFWFAKSINKAIGCIDATISYNYINGGAEPIDNSCFEFTDFNGSTISNNFIDYYRTIYHPKAISRRSFQGGISNGNQYQVFRYFVYPFDSNIEGFEFSSNNDCFNWIDPTTLSKLQTYEPLTATDTKGTIELPPYIGISANAVKLSITNAIIQSNVGGYGLFLYATNVAYLSNYCIFTTTYDSNVIKLREANVYRYYNHTSFNLKNIIITNCYIALDNLPKFEMGWSDCPPGTRVLYNNEIYTATIIKNSIGKKEAKWIKERESKDIYISSNRPVIEDINKGFCMFDTSIDKYIYWNGSSWIVLIEEASINNKGIVKQSNVVENCDIDDAIDLETVIQLSNNLKTILNNKLQADRDSGQQKI